MLDVRAPFAGKKITMMGLGLLGRGVGDVEFFANCGAKVLVTDIKDKKALAASVARLEKFQNVSFHLGKHDPADFVSADIVIKAAGVPLNSPEIAAAHKAGVPVYMSTALFAKYAREAGATIVGVTGTRGKSTIAHMIHHVLEKAGRRSVLGGNIRGISTLAMLSDIRAGDIAVLELDSWQLQGFGDLAISPQIAIFTNLMPDHMNYYGSDMEKYFLDKANIFMFQKGGDSLFVGSSVKEKVRALQPPVLPQVPSPIPEDRQLKIEGMHNRENAAFAVAALRALDLSDEQIFDGVTGFVGVEGRLQFVREVRGIKIYNDNNATTPEATIAALRALGSGKKNIVLVAGGADKNLDLSELVEVMNTTCKKVALLSGSGTTRLLQWFNAPTHSSLMLAMHAALQFASEGDIILFSPAFASFGMFQNEYERNDEFLRIVRAL